MSKPPKSVAPPPCHWPNRPTAGATGGGSVVGQAKAVRWTAPHPATHPARSRADSVQPMTTFAARRVGKSERASAGDELVRSQGDEFLLNSAERNVRTRPNGTYNFVRVQGDTRNDQRTYVSARSGHAGLAAGRPVLYAGTIRFDSGKLDWWSNYSGTYQPMADFRQQAQLPDNRFVPWQTLQMGGIGLQRGMFQDRRDATAPRKPDTPTRAANAPTVGSPTPACPPSGAATAAAPRPIAPVGSGASSAGHGAATALPASVPTQRPAAASVSPPMPRAVAKAS
ncbi:hypothetical protein [Azospirillum griseum]|uniref:Uncharacterized protein n=1 Tax=Azospirillum griseum TaxID=2496639 RepID=A0A3S0K252_9PROT|nr:hypothetical protein [Azospirillum griseum]RTR16272.1 hypothetical protein EJ903_21030 [Azospirillum griseum]